MNAFIFRGVLELFTPKEGTTAVGFHPLGHPAPSAEGAQPCVRSAAYSDDAMSYHIERPTVIQVEPPHRRFE